MKALTLRQPWATLIAIGAKKIQTRSWQTKYRGQLAIHSSRNMSNEEMNLFFREPFYTVLKAGGYTDPRQLPLGHVLAICDLVDCYPTPGHRISHLNFPDGFFLPPMQPERSFGDYSPRRYAWRLENIKRLDIPITALGSLSVWEWYPPLGFKVPA